MTEHQCELPCWAEPTYQCPICGLWWYWREFRDKKYRLTWRGWDRLDAARQDSA